MRTIDSDSLKAEIESLDAESNNLIYKCALEDMLQFFVELIDKQPTIEPEVRHGRWVEKVDNFHSNIPMRYSECSVCGRTENPCWAESWKYCPSCGAKMDGGVDNG